MYGKYVAWLAVGLVEIGLAACGAPAQTQTETVTSTAAPVDGGAGLANPASVYCTELGYDLAYDDATYTSECSFPDGTKCEEWTFFRGECGQTFSFCEKNGGKLEQRDGVATCVFADGSTCVESDFFTEKCKAGDNPAQ